jgi:hypothetical protein
MGPRFSSLDHHDQVFAPGLAEVLEELRCGLQLNRWRYSTCGEQASRNY